MRDKYIYVSDGKCSLNVVLQGETHLLVFDGIKEIGTCTFHVS